MDQIEATRQADAKTIVTKEMVDAATEHLRRNVVLGEDLVADWMPDVLAAALGVALSLERVCSQELD